MILRRPVLGLIVAAAGYCLCCGAGEPLSEALDTADRAFEALGSGTAPNAPSTASATEDAAEREFNERFPVAADMTVSWAHEFGTLRVETWNERVVQVQARIFVRADSAKAAAQLAEAVKINVETTKGLLAINTALPEIGEDLGPVEMAVDGTLTVPPDIALSLANRFGDTQASGLRGNITIDAAQGAVVVDNCAGMANIRARGAFPVVARGLGSGGTFLLDGTDTEIAGAHGTVAVEQFRGRLTIARSAPESEIRVTADSAPVDVLLATDANPALDITARHGDVESEWPAESRPADVRVLRIGNDSSTQKITIDTVFADVRLERVAATGDTPPQTGRSSKGKLFAATARRSEPATAGATLVLTADVGNVRIEQTDRSDVEVFEERIVKTDSVAEAPRILDRLRVSLRHEEGRVLVSSLMGPELPIDARVNLSILYPRGVTLELDAQFGETTVLNADAPVTVRQGAGDVAIENVSAAITVQNNRGNIAARGCSGSLDAQTKDGEISASGNAGTVKATCERGDILVENPRGELTLKGADADIRVLAFEGLAANLDAYAERGAIRLLIPENLDADLNVATQAGRVYSVVPLTGSIERDQQQFHASFGASTIRLRLETKEGDIYIDGAKAP